MAAWMGLLASGIVSASAPGVVPIGNPGAWMGSAAFPPTAIRAGESGDVVYALAVAPDGSVTGCSIVRSTAGSILDGETCTRLTAAARFEPAGVAGSYRGIVRWHLDGGTDPTDPVLLAERDLPASWSGAALRVSVRVRPDGAVTSCRLVRPSGRGEPDRETCARLARGRWSAARGDDGRPTGYDWEREVEWVGL